MRSSRLFREGWSVCLLDEGSQYRRADRLERVVLRGSKGIIPSSDTNVMQKQSVESTVPGAWGSVSLESDLYVSSGQMTTLSLGHKTSLTTDRNMAPEHGLHVHTRAG